MSELRGYAPPIEKERKESEDEINLLALYGLEPIWILKELRYRSPMSYETYISKRRDAYLGIKINCERVGGSSDKLVPWEERKKFYDQTLEMLKRKRWVEAMEYEGRELYWITEAGKTEYDDFQRTAVETLRKTVFKDIKKEARSDETVKDKELNKAKNADKGVLRALKSYGRTYMRGYVERGDPALTTILTNGAIGVGIGLFGLYQGNTTLMNIGTGTGFLGIYIPVATNGIAEYLRRRKLRKTKE